MRHDANAGQIFLRSARSSDEVCVRAAVRKAHAAIGGNGVVFKLQRTEMEECTWIGPAESGSNAIQSRPLAIRLSPSGCTAMCISRRCVCNPLDVNRYFIPTAPERSCWTVTLSQGNVQARVALPLQIVRLPECSRKKAGGDRQTRLPGKASPHID
jgi:hypothetical protein